MIRSAKLQFKHMNDGSHRENEFNLKPLNP
jgi:hypothetical protein